MSTCLRMSSTICLVFLLSFLLLSCVFQTAADPSFVSSLENSSEAQNVAHDSSSQEFIPTYEWQVVKDGQAIPPGLYVRMDLETGQKMARLLRDDEKSGRQVNRDTHASSAISVPSKTETEDTVDLDKTEKQREETAAHMFSKLHAAQDDPAGSGISPGLLDSEVESSILDMKNVLELMGAQVDQRGEEQRVAGPRYTDPQVIAESRKRVSELRSLLKPSANVNTIEQLLAFILSPTSSYEDVLMALDALEQLVHEEDDAHNWVKVGGMQIVSSLIEPAADALEDENEAFIPWDQSAVDRRVKTHRLLNLQSAACRVLGSAAQNNPEVGAAATASGLVRGLLQVLNQSAADIARDYRKLIAAAQQAAASSQSSLSKEEAVASSAVSLHQLRIARLQLQSRAFYALSAIIRHSDSAQTVFLEEHGPVLLKHFLLPEFSTVHLLKSIPICSTPSLAPQSVPLCINDEQLRDELELQAAGNFKAAAMLYDLLSDGIINSGISENSSSVPLFQALTEPHMCAVLTPFALQVVNVSFSLPSPLPSAFSVSQLVEPNFTSLSAREQILRLLSLLVDNSKCLDLWTDQAVKGALENMYWQHKWMWQTQVDLEKAATVSLAESVKEGEQSASDESAHKEKSLATEYLLSSYYAELFEIAETIYKFVKQQGPRESWAQT